MFISISCLFNLPFGNCEADRLIAPGDVASVGTLTGVMTTSPSCLTVSRWKVKLTDFVLPRIFTVAAGLFKHKLAKYHSHLIHHLGLFQRQEPTQ
jgi:hypothetical protein